MQSFHLFIISITESELYLQTQRYYKKYIQPSVRLSSFIEVPDQKSHHCNIELAKFQLPFLSNNSAGKLVRCKEKTVSLEKTKQNT